MKTRTLLAIAAAVLVAAPLLNVACNGDNSQTDSGPQNFDGGKDVQVTDTGTNDVQQTDGGSDGAACLTFDNNLVPGYPNNIPQP